VSSFLYGVMIFFFSFLFILYLVMYSANHSQSSSEMQTTFFTLVVPSTLKSISVYSFIGLLVIVPLYYRARLHVSASLIFEQDRVYIIGENITLDIPNSKIGKVFCNDLKNYLGKPKGILQVVIRQKGSRLTTFQLKDYEKGGELIDSFGKIEGITMVGYDNEMVTVHDDE
jgi:hypothetical protein